MPKFRGRYNRRRKKSKTYTSGEPLRRSLCIASISSVQSEDKDQEMHDQAQDKVVSGDEKGTRNKCTAFSKFFAS